LGLNAVIILAQGTVFAGTVDGHSGQINDYNYGGGLHNYSYSGSSHSKALYTDKARVLLIKWH
jgi:hypothetical protein